MIDLRSDTVTRPTPAMRAVMAGAEVGDDVYGEDPSVLALEARTAELLGKEEAVFVPSGTMSNQVALRTHAVSGDQVLMDARAHIHLNEGGAAAALSGLTVRELRGNHGIFTAADVAAAVERPHPFNPVHLSPKTALVCVENTHNGGGGVVWPMDTLRNVAATARSLGIALHLDGARLWHASAASGIAEAEYAELFDTVSVCFSKGLGAPVGSALAGSREHIARARRFKQMFGGGLRQAVIVAAGALHALEHHRARLADDIRNARTLAEGLARMKGIRIELDRVETNIVRFEVTTASAADFVEACHARGVFMLPGGASGVRAVTHLDVNRGDIERALEIIAEALEALAGG